MKVDLRPQPKVEPYVEHVAVMVGEVMPTMYRYAAGSRDEITRLTLERLLGELEHACRIARGRINA
jgi:hypothetical protein